MNVVEIEVVEGMFKAAKTVTAIRDPAEDHISGSNAAEAGGKMESVARMLRSRGKRGQAQSLPNVYPKDGHGIGVETQPVD